MILDETLRLKISTLKDGGAFLSDRTTLHGTAYVQGYDVDFTINVDLTKMTCMIICKSEGEETMQVTWELRREPTNLGIGEQWFFYNPYTGIKFRKLYYCRINYHGNSGGAFLPRHVISNPKYSIQMESKIARTYSQCHRHEDAYRKWGKFTYRGILTPYGKKMMKMEMYQERADRTLGRVLVNLFHRKLH